eukprot:7609861-Ditylum_brightwellii.AAC.1
MAAAKKSMVPWQRRERIHKRKNAEKAKSKGPIAVDTSGKNLEQMKMIRFRTQVRPGQNDQERGK